MAGRSQVAHGFAPIHSRLRARPPVVLQSRQLRSKNRFAVAQRRSDLPRSTPMKLPVNLGMILLGVWLILFGLLSNSFRQISFSHSGDVLAVLAIVVGVVLLLRR